MIRTKSVFDPKEENDGVRVLITRYPVRVKGFKKGIGYDLWLRHLAPYGNLLQKYQQGQIDWNTFAMNYNSTIDDAYADPIADDLFKVLHFILEGETVTLLCFERGNEDTLHCHRRLLKKHLEYLLTVHTKQC